MPNAAIINLNDSRAPTGFIYKSESMRRINSLITVLAPTDATVLITGESGTGKEIAAKTIHKLSGRAGKLVAINCSAISPTLLESELFGYEKGAFTGASARKIGKLEYADGGTVFLDEIGDMDKTLQAKLLRVLQEKAVERVGGNGLIKLDIRIIAATNKDIESLTAVGSFRDDLYHRLNVVRLHLPPLRERKEDVLPMAQYFANLYSKKYNRPGFKIVQKFENYLMSLDYPGNVRELKNVMEKAVIFADMESMWVKDVSPRSGSVKDYNLAMAEKRLVLSALESTGGSHTAAAEKLGVTVRTIHNKIKKYGITTKAAPSAAYRAPVIDIAAPSFNFNLGSDFQGLNSALMAMERFYISNALKETNGNRRKAAELLQIKRTTLIEKIKKLKILDIEFKED